MILEKFPNIKPEEHREEYRDKYMVDFFPYLQKRAERILWQLDCLEKDYMLKTDSKYAARWIGEIAGQMEVMGILHPVMFITSVHADFSMGNE
jgi:hypothetical protein